MTLIIDNTGKASGAPMVATWLTSDGKVDKTCLVKAGRIVKVKED